MEWYEIKNVDQYDSPALIIHVDRVKYNIQKAIDWVGSPDRLRPHVKTHKSAEVSKLCMTAGITKFKCATIAEAEMLAIQQASDVLIAYQLTGPKIKRLKNLITKYPGTRFSSLIDNHQSLDELSEYGKSQNIRFNIFIDLNVGMNRTGIAPSDSARLLVDQAISYENICLAGFQMYDGHIRDADIKERKIKSDACFDMVNKWLHTLSLTEYELICGGSPTFIIHANRKNVTCSPGTFAYWDHGYGSIPDSGDFLPAAVLISRVISKPGDKITIDLGHKAVAAENPIANRVHLLNKDGLKPVGQSEEHLVFDIENSSDLSIGEVIYGLPYHICPTVALYNKVLVAKDHFIVEEWENVSRGRSITV